MRFRRARPGPTFERGDFLPAGRQVARRPRHGPGRGPPHPGPVVLPVRQDARRPDCARAALTFWREILNLFWREIFESCFGPGGFLKTLAVFFFEV